MKLYDTTEIRPINYGSVRNYFLPVHPLKPETTMIVNMARRKRSPSRSKSKKRRSRERRRREDNSHNRSPCSPKKQNTGDEKPHSSYRKPNAQNTQNIQVRIPPPVDTVRPTRKNQAPAPAQKPLPPLQRRVTTLTRQPQNLDDRSKTYRQSDTPFHKNKRIDAKPTPLPQNAIEVDKNRVRSPLIDPFQKYSKSQNQKQKPRQHTVKYDIAWAPLTRINVKQMKKDWVDSWETDAKNVKFPIDTVHRNVDRMVTFKNFSSKMKSSYTWNEVERLRITHILEILEKENGLNNEVGRWVLNTWATKPFSLKLVVENVLDRIKEQKLWKQMDS